jgi:DNA-3-methyladenine glycosylase II
MAQSDLLYRRNGSISCIVPFEFHYSLEFIEGFRPMQGEQRISGGELTKAFLHEGQTVVCKVRQQSDITDPKLMYVLFSPDPLTQLAQRAIAEKIGFFLSANDDIKPFYALAKQDDGLAPLTSRLAGFHHPKFPSPFEAACWGVINQRIQIAAARKIKQALTEIAGGSLTIGGERYWAFPEPQQVAALKGSDLATIIKNPRKAKSIAALALAFSEVEDDFLQRAPLDEAQEWLQDIYGVGPFTSAFTLFRGAGRFVNRPMSSRFKQAAEKVYGRSLSNRDLMQISEKYGEWAGYWTLYIWASSFFLEFKEARIQAA